MFSYLFTFGEATLQIFLLLKRDFNQLKDIKHNCVFFEAFQTRCLSINKAIQEAIGEGSSRIEYFNLCLNKKHIFFFKFFLPLIK